MRLKKAEIQQMLREMNVKFDAGETYEALKQQLQRENHSLWLKSVARNRSDAGKTEKIVLKKRRESKQPTDPIPDPTTMIISPAKHRKDRSPSVPDHHRTPKTSDRQTPIEKPAPGKPWKAAAEGTEPFNRKKNVFETVLRRAKKRCERCGMTSNRDPQEANLEAFHILPISEGGEHSVKNVVALCPACRTAIKDTTDPKEIKNLKRKTRDKIYDSLKVVRRKSVGKRRS